MKERPMTVPRTSRRASRTVVLAVLAVLAAALASCSTPGSPAAPTGSPAPIVQTGSDGPVTDYADPSNWLQVTSPASRAVDVFYVYPTAYSMPAGSAAYIADVTDAGMRAGARSAYARQATAFEDVANVFAPYYRQADGAYALSLPPAEHAQVIEGAPLVDITAAFEHFLDHDNAGRPFMIVGHSQGADVSMHLLSSYVAARPELIARMVAAYVPGYSVTPEWLAANPALRFGAGATDTGVILSWNTEAPTVEGTNPVLLPGALAINPITWTTAPAEATAAQSLGSWLPDASGTFRRVEHYADARIDPVRGVVVSTTPQVDVWSPGGAGHFPKGVYHSFDIPFFYFDVQANAQLRVAAYLASH
jgi:hypothetical protein